MNLSSSLKTKTRIAHHAAEALERAGYTVGLSARRRPAAIHKGRPLGGLEISPSDHRLEDAGSFSVLDVLRKPSEA